MRGVGVAGLGAALALTLVGVAPAHAVTLSHATWARGTSTRTCGPISVNGWPCTFTFKTTIGHVEHCEERAPGPLWSITRACHLRFAATVRIIPVLRDGKVVGCQSKRGSTGEVSFTSRFHPDWSNPDMAVNVDVGEDAVAFHGLDDDTQYIWYVAGGFPASCMPNVVIHSEQPTKAGSLRVMDNL